MKDFNERVDECVNYTGINVRMTLYMDSTKHMLQKYTEFKHRSHFFFFFFYSGEMDEKETYITTILRTYYHTVINVSSYKGLSIM